MTDDEARQALASKYLKGSPDFNDLMHIILDKNRTGLPIRGILAEIGPYLTQGCSGNE